MSAARRIELQLQVSRYANQARALLSKSLEGFDARHVGGHEFSQIDLERNLSCACAEQFRNLRDTQTAGEPEDASIGLLNDADPALHPLLKRKTHATNEGILLRKPRLDATVTAYLTAGRDSSHDPLNAVGVISDAHRALRRINATTGLPTLARGSMSMYIDAVRGLLLNVATASKKTFPSTARGCA